MVAFRDNSGSAAQSASSIVGGHGVELPITHYQLLGLPRTAPAEAARNACDRLVKSPPATSYSHDTLFSRAVFLKAAAECLASKELRRSYDQRLREAPGGAWRVHSGDLPGALVLLQEIGSHELVLKYGLAWLGRNSTQPDAGDVAACVALVRLTCGGWVRRQLRIK